MKNNILIFFSALTIVSLTACNFSKEGNEQNDYLTPTVGDELAINMQDDITVPNKVDPPFIYDIGPRFGVIKKQDLDTIRSFNDFVDEDLANRILSYKKVDVIILDGDLLGDVVESSSNATLTDAQLKLLRGLDYSTNIVIYADFMEDNRNNGQFQNNYHSPYLTIVPDKQATYVDGVDVLKLHLKDRTEEVRADVDPEKLQAAKIYFTVSKNGGIENMYLDRPSGYPAVDKKLMELISKTKNDWTPAENVKGEKVDQVLVVSFGLIGC